jgi:hypothetical protein|eukprot:4332810-Prymnesium_polylepis.1
MALPFGIQFSVQVVGAVSVRSSLTEGTVRIECGTRASGSFNMVMERDLERLLVQKSEGVPKAKQQAYIGMLGTWKVGSWLQRRVAQGRSGPTRAPQMRLTTYSEGTVCWHARDKSQGWSKIPCLVPCACTHSMRGFASKCPQQVGTALTLCGEESR